MSQVFQLMEDLDQRRSLYNEDVAGEVIKGEKHIMPVFCSLTFILRTM